jgi:flagellar biosynthetic protein FliO
MNTLPRRFELACALLIFALSFTSQAFAKDEKPNSSAAPRASENTQTTPAAAEPATQSASESVQAEPTPAAPPTRSEENGEENDRLAFMAEEHAPASEAPSTFGLLSRTFGALLLIVGLIFGASWGLKRYGGARFGALHEDSPALSVLSTVALGDRRSLSIVKFGSRTLLVGSTQQSITLLAEESSDEVLAESNSPMRSVADMLKQSGSGGETENFAAELNDAHLRLEAGQHNAHWQLSEGGQKAS